MQVSIDTACSSALVGMHAAAQHLGRHGGAALSAGVNLMLAEQTTAATHIAGSHAWYIMQQQGLCPCMLLSYSTGETRHSGFA